MNDDKKPDGPESQSPRAPASAPAAPASAGPARSTAAEEATSGDGIPPAQMRAIIETLQTDLDEARAAVEAKQAQLEAANEKVLRGLADVENMRKRVEREKEETAKYAITKFARDIVLVSDNFERAIASVPADAKEGNSALSNLLDGVTLTEREFLNTLERHGVKRVAPLGEAFNPHLHQAVMEQADPSVPSGTVLQVYQVGYMIDDRVLRPAMVVVSTGGPKAGKAQAAERNANNGSAENGAGP